MPVPQLPKLSPSYIVPPPRLPVPLLAPHHGHVPVVLQGVRAEGFPEFHIFPPGNRPLYTPVDYVEPFTVTNQRSFGYDMFSETNRHDAMNEATRNDRPTATARVTLVQDG